MIRKIKTSLTAKLFLATTVLLILVCLLSVFSMARYIPQAYSNRLSAELQKQANDLVPVLEKAGSLEECYSLVQQFTAQTKATAYIEDDYGDILLMGLGAVSPLHGVTEAHALNAPVANSAQQKTVVSTTDDSDGVMSYKDKESGKTFVSEDNGASWMSEEDYNNSHPAINYEWWTYDEYKEWLEQEKKTLQEMADEHAMAETSEGSFEWTQEMTDQYIAEYEQTLEDIKNGLLVSKSVNGDDECMTTFNPDWVGSTTD